MRTPSQANGEIALGASEGFGIVGRQGPAPAAHHGRQPIPASDRRTTAPTPLGATLVRVVQAIQAFAGHLRASWRQRRRARAMRAALHALDARSLRDLGLDRSEVSSVVAELTGGAESTRLRCQPAHHSLRIW